MEPEETLQRGQQQNFGHLVAKVSIITTTEELLKTSNSRQRIQKQVSVTTAR
jgi:hypothetical protein